MRRVLKTLLAGSLLIGVPASTVLAQEASETAPVPDAMSMELARQIIAAGFPEDRREEVFFASMDQMLIQTREATFKAFQLEDEGAVRILDEWLADYIADSKEVLRSHIPSLMDGMAASYATIFTREELEDILTFVQTPSGKRFFELSPAILAEPSFAAANQAYMDEVQASMPAAMGDLANRIQTYLIEMNALEESNES